MSLSVGLIGWLVIIVAGLSWEFVAIRLGDTSTWPTLTRVIKTHAPKWIIVGAVVALAYHFLVQP